MIPWSSNSFAIAASRSLLPSVKTFNWERCAGSGELTISTLSLRSRPA